MIGPSVLAPPLLAASALFGWQPSASLPMRWSATSMPVPYCIIPNAQHTTVPTGALYDAVESGIMGWVSEAAGGGLSCSTYAAAPASYACDAAPLNDGKFNIFWSQDWNEGSATIGFTVSHSSGASCGQVTDNTQTPWDLDCKADADIVLNDANYTWTIDGATGTDVTSIVAHEYGHFIGLGHCNDNGTCDLGDALMYAAYAGVPIRTPRTDDTLGACALYPGTAGGLGWPCRDGLECSSLLCVNPGPAGYCSTLCGTCPFGYVCGVDPGHPGRDLCVRDDGLNRPLCGTCLPVPDGCESDGLCVAGLPDPATGRCITPCPQPGLVVDGGCPPDYTCLNLPGSPDGDYCVPKSQDCNDLSAYDVVAFGEVCDGSTWCSTGLECYGICSHTCTPSNDSGAPSDCETGSTCETFSDGADGVVSICVPAVEEGESCDGLTGCAVGPCLITAQVQTPTCYQSCLLDANACNNAQQCTHATVGETQVAYCTPAGVPPNASDGGTLDGSHSDASEGLDGGLIADANFADANAADANAADANTADANAADADIADADVVGIDAGTGRDAEPFDVADTPATDGGLSSDTGHDMDAAGQRQDSGPFTVDSSASNASDDLTDSGCACQASNIRPLHPHKTAHLAHLAQLGPWGLCFAGLLLRIRQARRRKST